MTYKFTVNGETLNVFHSADFVDTADRTAGVVYISMMVGEQYKEYPRTVRLDENDRKFFTWNKQKIYMDDFDALSPSELVKKMLSGKVFDYELCATLMRHGMDSIIIQMKTKKKEVVSFGDFAISFSTRRSTDKPSDFDWVDYTFVPEYLRMPKDCYKLKLVPANAEDKHLYPTEDFYVGDLVSLIQKCDTFNIKAKI